MNKWAHIIDDEKHETYYEALGLTERRAKELMEACKEAIRLEGGQVSREWDYALRSCNTIEEVVFTIHKLGEHAGGNMALKSLFTQSDDGTSGLEGLIDTIIGGLARASGGKVTIEKIKITPDGKRKREEEDDTEIKDSEHK